MRKWLLLAFVLPPLAATAQTPAPAPLPITPVVPEWAQVETIEVQSEPGPALWHVSKGNSDVWILGMIGTLPKGMTWNSQPLSEMLTGSRAIVMPPRAKLDLLDVGWFLIQHCCSLFRMDDGKLDDILPEPTRLRLASMRESVGGNLKEYQGDQPLGAAQRLGRDFMKKYELDGESPIDVVNKLASAKDVKQEAAFRFDPIPIIREAIKLTPPQQRPCLDAAMEDVERQKNHTRAMAEAWAVGNIRDVKAHYAEPRALDCIASAVRAMGALEQNRVPGFVAAIESALEKPGKTMVVIGMGPLLRKDGVLARLEAKGLKIEGPAE